MKYLYLILFLLLATSLCAQEETIKEKSWTKNQIQLGYNAFYFFDHGLGLSNNRLPSIYYSRYLKENQGIKIGLHDYFKTYRYCCEVGDVRLRSFLASELVYFYSHHNRKNKILWNSQIGISFISGSESRLAGFFNDWEPALSSPSYGELGLNIGSSIEYRIGKHFSLSTQVTFHRYFLDFNKDRQRYFKPTNYLLFGGVMMGWRF